MLENRVPSSSGKSRCSQVTAEGKESDILLTITAESPETAKTLTALLRKEEKKYGEIDSDMPSNQYIQWALNCKQKTNFYNDYRKGILPGIKEINETSNRLYLD